MKQLLLSVIVVVIIGMPTGYFGSAAVLKTQATHAPVKADVTTEKPDAEVESGDAKSSLDYDIVAMQPVITNLADASSVWVRLEGSFLIGRDGEAKPEELAVRLSQYVLAYLRTLKLTDLQGPGSLPAISQDLNEIVATMSNGQAGGLLISGLVFE